jgi:LPXTG-site transpeptidase (sortase) family protein
MHENGIEATPENYTLPPKTKHLKLKVPKAQTVLVSMAVLVFGMGLIVNLQTMLTNHTAKAQVAALASRSENSDSADDSGSVPSETKPAVGGSSSYRVAPNLPKYLKISKFSVNARVRPLGVTSNNQLKAPNNIYDTGWYDASAHPGDSGSLGAVLIDGHVHGPTLPGVFVGLKKMQAGDIVQIVRGDDKVFTYKVVTTKNYNAETMDMGELMASIKPGKPGLNLITCGGPYDKKSGEYTQRTVVFAVQI